MASATGFAKGSDKLPSIVDLVFPARTQPHQGHVWLAAVAMSVELYLGAWVTLTQTARPPLSAWANDMAMAIHAQLDQRHQTQVALEASAPPAPPPPPVKLPILRPRQPSSTVVAPPAVEPQPEAQVAPNEATDVLVSPDPALLRAPETTVVTGEGNLGIGGPTSAEGTGTNSTSPPSTLTGAKVPFSASGSSGKGPAIGVRLENNDWLCPWPAEAEASTLDEDSAVIRVLVDAKGKVLRVNVQADPGSGFGKAAEDCARGIHFRPAEGPDGQPHEAWSPAIRVRFVR